MWPLNLSFGFGPLRRIARTLHRNLPPLNFITLHYIYFVGTCLISAVIFWGVSTPPRRVSFTDSLFLTISAMTLAGLNTINLSTLNTFQQFMLFALIMLGSAIFVSSFVVHVRKKAFEKKFKYIIEKQRQDRGRMKSSRGSLSLVRRLSMSFARSDNRTSVPGNVIKEPGNDQTLKEGSMGNPDEPTNQKQTQDENSDINFEKPRLEDGDSAREPSPNQMLSATKSEHESKRNSAEAPDGSLAIEVTRSADEEPRGRTRTIRYQSENGNSIHLNPDESAIDDGGPEHITFGPNTYFRTFSTDTGSPRHRHSRFLSMQGVGAHSNASVRVRSGSRPSLPDLTPTMVPSTVGDRARKYLPFPSSGYISRNSQFHHLSSAEREQLGGCEYRAIQFLAWVVPIYFFLWQFLGCLGLGAYVANERPNSSRENGLNPWWVGSFNAVSAFNNSGMSLLDANMTAYQTSVYMLITMSLLILAGNTCYPIFLRLIVWTLFKLMPDNEYWCESRKTLRFLLDHPRRCYTNLFPSQHTWWLLIAVICLNGVDWAAFEILNIGNKAITSLPAGFEVLDGLFQAFAVRSGGFYVVNISTVRISLQVLYVVMMYISVYPVVITIRNSNVYEERSLGIYADDPGYAANVPSSLPFLQKLRGKIAGRPFEQTKSYFVRQQLRAQLAHDAWWIVLAIFLIMVIEGSQFEANPAVFSVFNVIFEVVSGYGCVGISVGLPNEAYSFCGAWHTLSKLVLCAVMIRGRHRGLPVAIDKAVLLPTETLHMAEEEDAQIRLERTISRGRVV
ncbi:TrkH-domain-containing protein [Glonium stellatum]|uniref:Potassium transport protein n=1 Tax=Glonium stellatum TaxID=574774 RepID=A0A8E2FBE8_9PEZI|nr:TrkH-domain-containing protein [Glonium stellatum]